jgi:type IV pilus assembly protein PilE
MLSTQGFTLIEVLVVVAILGVLTTVAYPSFIQQIRKSDRNEGKGALLEVMVAQETYRREAARFTANMSDLRVGLTPSGGDFLTTGGLYKVSIAAADRGSFTAVARAAGRQLQDKGLNCHAMALQVTLGGAKRGHLDNGGGFAESNECW